MRFGMGRGEVHEPAERLGDVVGEGGRILFRVEWRQICERLGEHAEQVVDRCFPQCLLRGEVVVDLWLERVDAFGDRPCGRAVEPLGGELHQRGLQQLLA